MPERRVRVSDPRALRALAHPLRLALLDRLMFFGEQTAAQCAGAVGSTASNCSYHLRVLARIGLVEPGESGDGRERPWRASATGLEFGPAEDSAAARSIEELALARDEQLTRDALAQRDTLPAQWRAVDPVHGYGLRVTAAELERLVAEIDALLRPYIALTRADAPDTAAPAVVRLVAYRHPEAT